MRKICTIMAALAVFGCLQGLQVSAQNKNKGPNPPGNSAKAKGAKKANHHNGKQLLGDKIKTNRTHPLDKKGDYTTSVEVKDGKVAGVHVKHAKTGT